MRAYPAYVAGRLFPFAAVVMKIFVKAIMTAMLAIASTLAFPLTAAQAGWSVNWSPGYIAAETMGIQTAVMDQVRSEGSSASVKSGQSEEAAPAFRYTPSKVRTRANLAQFVSKTRTVNPGDATKLEKLFASTDVIGDIGSGMRRMGLRSNDVADAYTLWWVSAWHAVQGRPLDQNPQTLIAVREQAARAIAATGKFGSASDALRQEMAESLMIQAAMVDEANDQMRGDPNQRRALATAVNKGARGMGLDLTSMTLTKQGFQPRKRSDAGEAIGDVEGAEPEALAASSVTGAPANDTDDRTGTYALIAAAGGAGLTGMFMVGRAAGRKG